MQMLMRKANPIKMMDGGGKKSGGDEEVVLIFKMFLQITW